MAKPHSLLDAQGKPRFPRRLSTLIRIAFDDMELFLDRGGVLYMGSWAESDFEIASGTTTCSACMAGAVLLGSYKYREPDILTALSVAPRVADGLNAIRCGYLLDALIGYYPKRTEYFYALTEDDPHFISLESDWRLVLAPMFITTKEELAEYKAVILPLVKRLAKLGY